MNRQQKAYAKKIDLLRRYINDNQQILHRLIRKCQHLIVRRIDSAICDICGTNFGWYCEKSPTKYCDYKAGSEFCIHCKISDERK
jgi:hypothetical protein